MKANNVSVDTTCKDERSNSPETYKTIIYSESGLFWSLDDLESASCAYIYHDYKQIQALLELEQLNKQMEKGLGL